MHVPSIPCLVNGFQKKQSAEQNREGDPKMCVGQYAHYPPAGLITAVNLLHVVLSVQTERLREIGGFHKRLSLEAGVPLLAPSVCRLNPDMPRGLAPEHTKPIGWAGSVSVVGRVDRLLAGKDAGLVQSRCLRAAHLGSAPAPPQLLSSSAVQGMGSGKVATSRSITSTRCRMVSVGSLGRRGRFSRR